MRFLFAFLFLLSTTPYLAQSVVKKTGEVIILTACGTEGNVMNFYRKTGVSNSASKIGSVQKKSGELTCQEIKYTMPGGSTREYRFFAVPVVGSQFLSESNGVIAIRQ